MRLMFCCLILFLSSLMFSGSLAQEEGVQEGQEGQEPSEEDEAKEVQGPKDVEEPLEDEETAAAALKFLQCDSDKTPDDCEALRKELYRLDKQLRIRLEEKETKK